ncbi:MAG: hypothetical protein SGI91_07095 [Alphaproteobacteria bacterium]|jgi:hypothetical protein|nr:hypothetical protein [Alphaproteobacteria bacterium]
MLARFALALSGTLLGAASAFAANPTGAEWSIDYSSIRVLRLNPMVIGGGMSGDRVMIDIHRESDNVKGTLSISCVSDEYSLWTAESLLLASTRPLSDWPLAAQLAANYCVQVDHLPEAGNLMLLDIKSD